MILVIASENITSFQYEISLAWKKIVYSFEKSHVLSTVIALINKQSNLFQVELSVANVIALFVGTIFSLYCQLVK